MQLTSRVSIAAAVLIAVGFGIWSYSRSNNLPAQPAIVDIKSNAIVTAPNNEHSKSVGVAIAENSTNNLDALIADISGSDAAARAAAITALGSGDVPKERALPLLEGIVNGGELSDRKRALASLRNVALQQGDHDGAVRNIVRQAIYHSEDDGTVQSARVALDEIETALASSQASSK